MVSPTVDVYYLVSLALVLVAALYFYSWHHPKNKLPPGPRGIPLLGNLFQIPRYQWLRFTEWRDRYGPIIYLNLAGQPIVVLNTHSVAADLLDRRSSIYSDRPRFIMAGEILTGGIFMAFAEYGDLWRRLRRATHDGFSARAAATYRPLQERGAARLVLDLLSDPESWDNHLKRSTTSTVLSAIYGSPPNNNPNSNTSTSTSIIDIDTTNAPIIDKINTISNRIVRAALPGTYLVDTFPILRYLPEWMVQWKREGMQHHREDSLFFEGLLGGVERENSEHHQPCFAATLLQTSQKHGLTRKESAWLAGSMFGAGAETTAAALSVFFLAMVLYPDAMRKAQNEIDSVVGRDRLPSFSDQDDLPYIRAMVKEVLRWRPVAPLGLARRSVQDDWYNGYFIPKGTIVMHNTWAINRDPAIFPDFDEFRPERFLDSTGKMDYIPPDMHNQGHATYGFGRRICPGMLVANQALFINIATVLWAVNIEKASDASGEPILPSRTDCVDEGIVVRPVPFRCAITARFDKDGFSAFERAMVQLTV